MCAAEAVCRSYPGGIKFKIWFGSKVIVALKRAFVATAGMLLLAHVAVVATLGTTAPGPVLSDLLQLSIGGLVILACVRASQRSEGLPRSFWRLAAGAYVVWSVAQSLSIYVDLSANAGVSWIINLLFCFWFVPLAMAMFLDPENEARGLDALVALDFVQAVLVCVAAYLYFFYLPKAETNGELAHSVWAPYFAGYGFVAGAFLLRAMVTQSRVARALFGRLGIFLCLSGIVDALYYYGPGSGLRTGAWFDLLWSMLLIVPLVLATSWQQASAPEAGREAPVREKRIHTELFFLLYPLLILVMSLRIARARLELAAGVIFLSFVCSSARLLITQNRLVCAQEALGREAARDGLTSLWNHKSILEILDREGLRAARKGESLGIIMADVDHFKAINDTRGHVAGDAVLRIIASEIAAVVRPYDSVGRYGGEEFLIVAPGCNLSETWELAERIRNSIARCSIIVGGSSVEVTLSLGIANGNSAEALEKLLPAADSAMYQAKNAGRNRVEPSLTHSADARVAARSDPQPQNNFWL